MAVALVLVFDEFTIEQVRDKTESVVSWHLAIHKRLTNDAGRDSLHGPEPPTG